MKNIVISLFLLLMFTPGLFAQDANQERLEEMVGTLASDEFLGRGFGSKGGKMAMDYIIEEFKKSGIEPFVKDYKHEFNTRRGVLNIDGTNIIGIVRGTDKDLSNEYVIIGAHYDHVGFEVADGDTIVYNGADDNATGVAAIIEIGRMLNENRKALGRSVLIIAFDGEESGLLGSEAVVAQLISEGEGLIEPDQVAAMFSLDMVGMYDTHGGVELNGVELLGSQKELISKVQEKMDISIRKTNDQIPGRTDTAPFAKIGIPSVHVFTGTESPYHKPEDDSELLEYEGMKLVTDFIYALVKEISVAGDLPRTKQMEQIAEKGSAMKTFNPGIIANLGGTHFDFKDEYLKAKGVFAYGAGFMLETRISQWLALQPEVLYEWTGSQVLGGNIRTHSVTVPVNILITTPDQGMGIRTYYSMGGYYSYAFAGKDASGNDLDFGNDFSETDYGYAIGIGMEIMNFRIGWSFQSSLVDFTPNNPILSSNQSDIRLKASYLRVGWAF